MVDFSSALYLALAHPSESLKWTQLSTGTPAALRRSVLAGRAEAGLRLLLGTEAALVLPSTLHACFDLFGTMARAVSTILHDEFVYPIARWGVERAERAGARAVPFSHLAPHALEARLQEAASRGEGEPWIVSDGFCTGCGRFAPLAAYAKLARRFGARLIVDDTQSLGIHGSLPSARAPYGLGGGGSVRRFGLEREPRLVLLASLAKAFGVPLTLAAGAQSFIAEWREQGETLVHCSPPAEPLLAATMAALSVNSRMGDALRARLAANVEFLREALRARGFSARGGIFPVQSLVMPDSQTALAVQARMRERGVAAVVRRSRCNERTSLTLIVSAQHSARELSHGADALASAVARTRANELRLSLCAETTAIVRTNSDFNMEVRE